MPEIVIRGAKTHNLKNIDVSLPRDQLIVITGLSGSGKSSLAFDTLYAEGQRRYVESLSAYARQFLSMMQKPDVEHIEGLSPAISIEQKATSHNPRSTVGTVTEIYDYLRLLYARVGEPRCPTHQVSLNAQTINQMVDQLLSLPEDSKILILAPVVQGRKGEHKEIISNMKSLGFVRLRIDGTVYDIEELPELAPRKKHDIEVVVDRLKIREDSRHRLTESIETALNLADGLVMVADMDHQKSLQVFSSKFACTQCGYSIAELAPRIFSFNNPKGACLRCDGLGVKSFFDADRVITSVDISLAGGAVRGWDKRNLYYFGMITSLANHYHFDVDQPFKNLPEHIKKIILHGSGDEKIEFHYHFANQTPTMRKHRFEGVLPNLERRYRETDSSTVREELTKYLSVKKCDVCEGDRLCEAARFVYVADHTLPEVSQLTIEKAKTFFEQLTLTGYKAEIAEKILKEIIERLTFLINVGLNYLTLARSAETLSGGEAQRIRLASQIGSGLVGVMYILDEPSIGLHQRDNARLLETLTRLRDLGNTVIVVEHDEEAIRAADHLIDMGPRAGVHGGEVIAQGQVSDIIREKKSITGQYLSGKESMSVPEKRCPSNATRLLTLSDVHCNNLEKVTVTIPIGLFTCVTGVSGSGKSSLINDTLYPYAANELNRAQQTPRGTFTSIEGLEYLDKVIEIDQSPIGRTPRSNPATYTGLFTPIRELMVGTPEARTRGYKAGRFSFNVKGGRCEACQGDGVIKVEMHFLADIYVMCDVCQGKRYNRETLEIRYKGKNIYEILEMTVEDAHPFFKTVSAIERRLKMLMDVGLSYITLGQSATTLSGGEAQRVKLAKELAKRDTSQTLYILDEPTTGLHFHDIKQLLTILHRLRDQGNTLVVIEHNLDVIKTADWIIDLGPEGGDKGGKIVVTGTPETVAKHPTSYTGHFLKPLLKE